MMIAAATMLFAGCEKNDGEEPEDSLLTVSPESIDATGDAGSYTFAVANNATWIATVNPEAAAWCRLVNASATGNGTVTVITVADNMAAEPRIATITVSAGALTQQVSVAQESMIVFTDPRDGIQYKTVKMPDGRVWFAENLRYTKHLVWNQQANMANGVEFVTYENGAPAIGSYWIPAEDWATFTPDMAPLNIYGALYTWETAMMVDGKWSDESKTSSAWNEAWVSNNYYGEGAKVVIPAAKVNNARGGRGICPPGWHIPTDYEWAVMLDAINGTTLFTNDQTGESRLGTNEGGKLKSTATYTGPDDPGNGAWRHTFPWADGTDLYGFCAVPAGYRMYRGLWFTQRYYNTEFWSSSANDSTFAWFYELISGNTETHHGYSSRSEGFSVRCISDK
jgi:uncharacterized protein (TIGR02145 family)